MSKHLYELNGWINREGKIFYCPPNSHKQIAEKFNTTEYNLEKMGWVKIYNGDFLMSDKCCLRPASHQCAKILDLCMEYDSTERWKEFCNKYANK